MALSSNMPPPEQRKVFISYRRKDPVASNFVFRFFEKLETHYGEGNVFLDIDRLPLGVDFRQVLVSVIGEVQIVFVLIGPTWTERLKELRKSPKDYVKMEVEMAMAKPGMRVVPILLTGAQMPREQDLPPSLKNFPHLQGTSIDQHYFHEEMSRIFKSLDKDYFLPVMPDPAIIQPPETKANPLPPELVSLLTEPERPASPARRWLIPTVGLVAVLLGAWAFVNNQDEGEKKTIPVESVELPPDPPEEHRSDIKPTPPAPSVPERIKQIALPGDQKLEFVRVDKGNVNIVIGTQSREVEVSTFWISRNPVTKAQWQAIMVGNSLNPAKGDNTPKTEISFAEIIDEGFLTEFGKIVGNEWDVKLPTEAQWIGAATAATAGGPEYGTYLASFIGGGKEWCNDRYQNSVIGIPRKNPTGPSVGNARVVRGGSGSDLLTERVQCQPNSKEAGRGFRVVLNAIKPD